MNTATKTTSRLLPLAFSFALPLLAAAQSSKEANQPLSKPAQKGMLVQVAYDNDGQLKLTYKMKVNKKSDEVAYEDYVFDADLNYKGIQPTQQSKETKPNKTVTTLSAFVGGGNSFNVMSMTLNLQREEWEKIWDYDRQQYNWGKRLSKESVKLKNSDSKYKGFASFANDDEGSQFVIASYDQDKSDNDQFVCLYITNDMTVKEAKVPANGDYSLVYCNSLESGNVFMVLAPNKGMPDVHKYIYAEFTNKADLVSSFEFTAPSSNLLITNSTMVNGALYLCGASTKSDDAYNKVFSNYAPIFNPGYSTSANKLMDKYEKKVYGEEFDNFHLLKIENGQLKFASTTPISAFKEKVKTPPAQRKAHPYKGQTFVVQDLSVAPNGDYLVTGQIEDKKIVNGGKDVSYRFYDIVCLHFDASGNLKAQYDVEKANDDSKSEMFQNRQSFFFSPDGKYAYWEILEVKGTKGYDSFADAFLGNTTFMANYFPRIAKISLADASISDFTVLGDKGKFLTFRNIHPITDTKTNTRYYVGHDEDYEKVWVGKAVLQ